MNQVNKFYFILPENINLRYDPLHYVFAEGLSACVKLQPKIEFDIANATYAKVCFLKYPPAKGRKSSANLTNAFNIVFMNSEGKV